MSCRLLYLYMKQVNDIKGNLSTNLLFYKFFLIIKHNSKAATAVVIKKIVPKTFGILIGKHPCWSLFSIKLQAFRTVA